MAEHCRLKRGFTLIEMLVVISIIVLLASILFPVFATAREKARSASCLSNQKQIAMAISMYSQDNDELNLPAVDPGSKAWWESTLQPYIRGGTGGGILACPSAASRAYAYSLNWSLGGRSQAAITSPSDTILMADGAQAPQWADPQERVAQAVPYFFYTFPGLGEALWSVRPNFQTGAGDPNATIRTDLPNSDTNAAQGLMRFRHSEGVNAAFADGHIKYLRKGASRLRQWDPLFQTQ
jgi:prepilin-type N-terminal cleavage/methylation domain-containing protein/prepilin-type processing-associated H-X9-DG protein